MLFCGLPGSGKTTLSKEVCRVTSAHLIDLDDFKKVDVDPSSVTSEIDPPEVRWKYYQKGVCEAARLFDGGVKTIVLDEVFHLAELRERINVFCHAKGISTVWVEVKCPYDIVKERLLSKPRIGHILSTAEALAMYQMFTEIFEPFEPCSQHIVINNVDSDFIGRSTNLILDKIEWK